jgi:translation initiation factor IF-1
MAYVTTPIAPAAPGALSALAISGTQINLTWTDQSNNETGFRIERKTGAGGTYSEIATVGANVTAYSNGGLPTDTTFYYRIRAYNSAGNSPYTGEVTATTGSVPSAPTDLSATAISGTQINLLWSDQSGNETGFRIERKTGAGGTYSEIATVGTNITSYSNAELSYGVTYYYRLRAYNSVGISPYTSEASATTPQIVPPTPAALEAARNRGLAWLVANQNGDGNWRGGIANDIAPTALALQALANARFSLSSYPRAAGIAWLANTNATSVDSLARQVQTLAPVGGQNHSALSGRLKSWVNKFGGWGGYERYGTDVLDTALALGALRVSGSMENHSLAVFCELLPYQQPSGGWFYGIGPSNVIPTAHALIELFETRQATSPMWDSQSCAARGTTSSIVAALSNGRSFLATRRNADGGYGDRGNSTAVETAITYKALMLIDPTSPDSTAALNYLLSKQDPIPGNTPAGWDNNALTTAMVLSVLPPLGGPAPDTDGDGIPDAIEVILGRNPSVPDSRVYVQGSGTQSAPVTAAASVTLRFNTHQFKTIALAASGGVAPLTWSIASGSLPPGLSLNSNLARVEGTPTAPENRALVFSVRDATGNFVNVQASVLVSASARDFDGDGKADILWRHQSSGGTGENYLWPMDGTTMLSTNGPINVIDDLNWKVAGIGDLDADGKADIVWRHTVNGEVHVYLMDGRVVKANGLVQDYQGNPRVVPDLDWNIVGVGDFNGDGRADILWRHFATGENYIYPMDGLAILPSEGYIRTQADLNWKVVGTGDFDGDGKADILWRNFATGGNYIFPMDGLAILPSEGYISTQADQNWKVVGTGDFNGDGKADILWRHFATGQNYVYPMEGLAILPSEGYVRTQADLNWKVVATADFDGDGKGDILWRHMETGENYIYPMDGLAIKPSEGYTSLNPLPDLHWTVVPE